MPSGSAETGNWQSRSRRPFAFNAVLQVPRPWLFNFTKTPFSVRVSRITWLDGSKSALARIATWILDVLPLLMTFGFVPGLMSMTHGSVFGSGFGSGVFTTTFARHASASETPSPS